jgi:cell division protein FtsN
VELRNQIDYLRQRCVGVDTTRIAAGAAAGGPPPTPSSRRPAPGAQPESRAADRAVASPAPAWSVQIGAFRRQADAERLRSGLASRGYDARVYGPAPGAAATAWRVRIGRYATRADAAAALERLRRRDIDGFVVEAERR